jgi:hypothetical protein
MHYVVEIHLAERQLKGVFDTHNHTHRLGLEFPRVCISGERVVWCSYTAEVGDRSLAAVAILHTGAYGNMEVDEPGARHN